ncbi:MAG: hypothetical protein AAF682_21645 [Planctomycetota bacterium]
MEQQRHKRRIKIIKPRLQLKLVGIFVGLATLSVLLQSILLARRLTQLSAEAPAGGDYLVDALPSIVLEILVFTFGLIIPLIFAVGVLITHRIAGPIYRFEQHLMGIVKGEKVRPCKIRDGDELQELCQIINMATETLSKRGADEVDSAEPAAEDAGQSASESEPNSLRRAG